MKCHVPPECQGQIVEHSWSVDDPDYLVERVFDQSDRTVAYYISRWNKKLDAWADSAGPQNTPPPGSRSRRITQGEFDDLFRDLVIS